MTAYKVISNPEFRVIEKINDFQSSTSDDFGSIIGFRNSGRESSSPKRFRDSQLSELLGGFRSTATLLRIPFSSVCFSGGKFAALKFSPGK